MKRAFETGGVGRVADKCVAEDQSGTIGSATDGDAEGAGAESAPIDDEGMQTWTQNAEKGLHEGSV